MSVSPRASAGSPLASSSSASPPCTGCATASRRPNALRAAKKAWVCRGCKPSRAWYERGHAGHNCPIRGTEERAGVWLSAGECRARCPQSRAGQAGRRQCRRAALHRRRAGAHRQDPQPDQPALASPLAGGVSSGRGQSRRASDLGSARGPSGLGGVAVAAACGGVPESGGPFVGAVADAAQCLDDARAVQDLLPGRDRCRLRAGRLLSLQRLLLSAPAGSGSAA
jgi:hypothetical protein